MPPTPHTVSDSESRMTALQTQSPNPHHERPAATGMSATQKQHPSGLQLHWRVVYHLPNHPPKTAALLISSMPHQSAKSDWIPTSRSLSIK